MHFSLPVHVMMSTASGWSAIQSAATVLIVRQN
jgi:hypothetical protein